MKICSMGNGEMPESFWHISVQHHSSCAVSKVVDSSFGCSYGVVFVFGAHNVIRKMIFEKSFHSMIDVFSSLIGS